MSFNLTVLRFNCCFSPSIYSSCVWPIAADPVACCVSLSVRQAAALCKKAKGIEVLFVVETHGIGNPGVLGGGPHPPTARGSGGKFAHCKMQEFRCLCRITLDSCYYLLMYGAWVCFVDGGHSYSIEDTARKLKVNKLNMYTFTGL